MSIVKNLKFDFCLLSFRSVGSRSFLIFVLSNKLYLVKHVVTVMHNVNSLSACRCVLTWATPVGVL